MTHWIKRASQENINKMIDELIPMLMDETIISYCKKFKMNELSLALEHCQFPYNYRTAVLFMED